MKAMDKALYEKLVRSLTDDGKLMEAGWTGYLLMCIPDGASAVQVEQTRWAFFAGAAHLYSAMMGVLEPGKELTENDLNRLAGLHAELTAFQKQFEAKYINNPRED